MQYNLCKIIIRVMKNQAKIIKLGLVYTMSIIVFLFFILFIYRLQYVEIKNKEVVLVKYREILNKTMKKNEVMFPSIDSNKLVGIKYNLSSLSAEYCLDSQPISSRKIISNDPLIVNCDGYYVSNGQWRYNLYSNSQQIIGDNSKYLILSDLSLIEKSSGNQIKHFIGKKNTSNLSQINSYGGSSAISLNMRIFTTKIVEKRKFLEKQSSIIINEVNAKNENKLIIEIMKSTDGNLSVPIIKSSKNGKYLFVLVENTRRGQGDLFIFIIEVQSKLVILKKTLESNSVNIGSYYLKVQDENILLSYSNPSKLFWYKFITKEEVL